MLELGTPLTTNAKKLLLLGSGELGKEIAIEAQRLGLEVIAVDHYPNAPAMHIAHRSHTINMLDAGLLKKLIKKENPDYIVPEIEAIATDALVELEEDGFNVIPNAKAVRLTMDREGIRRLAAEQLKLNTSPYFFVDNKQDYLNAVKKTGFPCVVKPTMSSSGKGQSIVKDKNMIETAWNHAQKNARGKADKVIVEQFIPFDYEVTILTVRYRDGNSDATGFCSAIGHTQVDGDYRESWQPHIMSDNVSIQAYEMAKTITDALGGYGVFGVELFVKDEQVYFNEVSPRPHDTGMVTMASQHLSQFALHVRAILGLPISYIDQHSCAASAAIVLQGDTNSPAYCGLKQALQVSEQQLPLAILSVQVRLFGKPEIHGKRRMGVAIVAAKTTEAARKKARHAATCIQLAK